MRRSVKIKNFIAKLIMYMSIIIFIFVASNPDNMNITGTAIALISFLTGRIGYKLWLW